MSALHRLAPVLLATAALAVGCGGNDGPDEAAAPPETTPAEVKSTIYEHTLSECSSHSAELLAGKYHTKTNRQAIALAAGRSWAKVVGATGDDAVRAGRDGCLAGFDQASG